MTGISKYNNLIDKAILVSKNSYSPYSRFPVGSALEDFEGNIFTGCNVENLALPSSICAERSAIFSGISKVGVGMKIKTIVIYTPTNTVSTPCGACRQVINEFAHPNTSVICVCNSDEFLDMKLTDLLPESPIIKF